MIELMENDGTCRSVTVSVCVITYNQESFISQCLQGIVNQKVDFPIEVIVGEDCSADNTAAIVNDFAERNPDTITAICRTENLGRRQNFVDVVSRAKGEFIAICEGDDFWTDVLKLQKQYDSISCYPNIDICFHPAIEKKGRRKDAVISKHYSTECVVSLKSVILGRGGFMPSASLLIRKSSFYPLASWLVHEAPAGDTFIQILGSIRGGALYLPEVMSVYRRYVSGSVTQLHATHDFYTEKKIEEFVRGYCIAYEELKKKCPTESYSSIETALAYQLAELALTAVRLNYFDVFRDIATMPEMQIEKMNVLIKLILLMKNSNLGLSVVAILLRYRNNSRSR